MANKKEERTIKKSENNGTKLKQKSQSTKTTPIKSKKKGSNKLFPKTKSEILLTAAFLVLLIVVIILAVKAVNLKKEQNSKKDIDLVIPILDEKINSTFSVDISKMKSQDIKEYKFRVTNYKDNKITKKDIDYNIELTNKNENLSIKLYKNKTGNNLLTETTSTQNIENNKLSKGKKNEDTYYLIIRMKDEIKEKENITIKITSTN